MKPVILLQQERNSAKYNANMAKALVAHCYIVFCNHRLATFYQY